MALDLECKIIEEELKEFWPEWHVVRYIGGGAFGKVFHIYKVDLGVRTDSALKVLRIDGLPAMGQDSDSSDRTESESGRSRTGLHGEHDPLSGHPSFTNEIRIMETLRGAPNIVAIQDFYYQYHKERNSGHLYVRMELLTSFRDLLNKRKSSAAPDNAGSGMVLPVHTICKFSMDICRALVYCEDNHIIHRDIKPENLFVDRFGNFKIGDFGVSRSMATVHMADSMTSVGTISYMAPEIYRHRAYNNTVDIYSLGLVLYQLLNQGRMPFLPEAPSAYTVSDINGANYKRLTGEEIPPLKGVDPALDLIIRKACAYRPEDRYQSARAFYNAISRYSIQQSQMQRQLQKQSQAPSVNRNSAPAASSAQPAVSTSASSGSASGAPAPAPVPVRSSSAIESPGTAHSLETAQKKNSRTSILFVLAAAAVIGIVVITLAISGSLHKHTDDPSDSDAEAAIEQQAQGNEEYEDDGETTADENEDSYDDTIYDDTESVPAGKDDVIVFSDPGLEQAVRDSLGIGDEEFTIADAGEVTSLDCSRSEDGIWYGINDISDLSYFTKLKDLDLSDNHIYDLTPLEGLVCLERLNLADDYVEDLSPLRNLVQLKDLNLEYNTGVTDISPLAGLVNMEHLSLEQTDVEDLSALRDMKQLQEIRFDYAPVKDASVLGELTELRTVDLTASEITDISFLSHLEKLESLDLTYTQIQDISALSELKNLKELYLWGINFSDGYIVNNMIDLSPIAGLVSLEKLSLDSDALSDVSVLSDLKNLEELCLSGVYIFDGQTDLLKQSLSGMKKLKVLDISGTGQTDLSLIEGLTQLEKLYIGGNVIEDLSPLTKFTELKALYAGDNLYTDISCLSELANLSELEIGTGYFRTLSTEVSVGREEEMEISIDLTPLRSMDQLKVLVISELQVEDLSIIEHMTDLQKLYLSDCGISDLSAVSSFKNLEYLNLSYNQITDISPLSDLTNLRELDLSYNKVEDISAIANMKKLEFIDLDGNPIKDYLPIKDFSDDVVIITPSST